MRIGIISDTHDNIPKIKEGIAILNQRNVDFLLHCGDYVAPFALNPLKELVCDWIGVFGNNDGEKKGLAQKSEGRIKEPPHFLALASKKITLVHECGEYDTDIIAFGHTHTVDVSSRAGRLYINPGEIGGWLYGKSSLVILDMNTMKPEVIYL